MNSRLKHTMFSLWNILTVSAFVAAFAALAVFVYWTVEPKNVIEVVNQPVPVRPDTISPEATVIVSPTFCKYLNKPAKVERFLISDSARIPLPVYPNNLPRGCKTYDLPVVIPAFVTDDVYHLEYNTTYQINPITEFKVHWYTQNFTVKHDPPLQTSTSPATISPTKTPQAKTQNPDNLPSKPTTSAPSAGSTPNAGIIQTTINGVRMMAEQAAKAVNNILGR